MSLDFTSPESTAISRIYEQYDGLAANDSNDLSDAGTTVSDESAQTSETSATNESIGAVTSAVQDPYKGMKTNLISPHPVGGVVDTITTLTDTDQALEDDMSERGFIQPNSTIIDVMGCSLNEHINEAAEKNSFRPTEMIQTRTDSVLSLDLPSLSGKLVGAPAQYVGSMPGKKIRDKAANALNIWLMVNEENLQQIREVINLLHNASLILDDVEDGSVSRRGRPATHMVFGTSQAINAAGYQINKAMIEVMKLGNLECIEIFVEEMDRLYIGQGHDLFWTFNIERPSVKEYISMVDYKTGALFHMLVRFMVAKNETISPVIPDLKRLVVLLGRYFQIRDDYMNLTSEEYTDQKGFCEDLDEGKFSLTLIHALEHAPKAEYSILRHTLLQRHIARGMALSQKYLILDILKATGSLQYTVDALREIGKEISVEVDHIERETGIENKSLRTLLELLKV